MRPPDNKKFYKEPDEDPEIDEEKQREIEALLKENDNAPHEIRGRDLQFDLIIKEREKSIKEAEEMRGQHPELLVSFQNAETNFRLTDLLEDANYKFENTRRYEDVAQIYQILIDMGYSDTASVMDAIRSKSIAITSNVMRRIIEVGDADFGVHLGIVDMAIKSRKEAKKTADIKRKERG